MDERELNPLANLPNASMAARERQAKEKPRMEAVVDKPIELREKKWTTRAKEAIFNEDSSTIGGYILKEVIIPAVRDTLYDMVTGAMSMALYSTPKASRSTRSPNRGGYVSYGSYWNYGDQKTRPKAPEPADRYRTKLDIYNIPLPSDFPDNPSHKSASAKGYAALEALGDRMEIYNEVTVQDLYDVLGIGSAPSTMSNWGWNDISSAKVEFDRGEWVLRMPKAIPLR